MRVRALVRPFHGMGDGVAAHSGFRGTRARAARRFRRILRSVEKSASPTQVCDDGEDADEKDETYEYDWMYLMPVGGIGEDDYSEARAQAKTLEDDEHVSVAGGEFGAMLQLVRTYGEDKEEAEHLRQLVKRIEDSYYNCLALETDTKILVFMRLRNLYGGVLDEDEIIEEATRAAKTLEGNIALLYMSDRKKEVEELDFDADRFVGVFKEHVGAIVEELERDGSRWA